MKEVDLVRNLIDTLRKELAGAVVFKHADTMTAGIPDISVTWGGMTTWLEVKYQTGEAIGFRAAQDQMMIRLRLIGSAYYVLYEDRRGTARATKILDPGEMSPRFIVPGFNHKAIAEFIRNRK